MSEGVDQRPVDGRAIWRRLLCDEPRSWAAVRMDAVVKATAALPPRAAPGKEVVQGLPNTFVVGSYATRITIRDQQWMGLEVAEAVARLFPDEDPLAKPRPIGIVGGGFAGTAAALLLAHRHKIPCVIIESTDLLSTVDNSKCSVHRDIWDWPIQAEEVNGNEFPSEVRKYIEWPSTTQDYIAAGQLRAKLRNGILEGLKTGGARLIRNQKVTAADIHAFQDGVAIRCGGEWHAFRALLLCVGFGSPKVLSGARGSPKRFWDHCETIRAPDSHLVIGGGDTALMTAIELVTSTQPIELLSEAIQVLDEPFKLFGEELFAADMRYERCRGLSGRWPTPPTDHDGAVRRALVRLHDNRKDKWDAWRNKYVHPAAPKVTLVASKPLHESRSSRANRALCSLLHLASRYLPQGTNEKGKVARSDLSDRDLRGEGYKREERLLRLPLYDIASRAIDDRHPPLPGLTIATGFSWVAEHALPDDTDALHLLRNASGTTTVGAYSHLHPCIGPDHPELLQQLSNRIDLEDLRSRQHDWRWY